MVPLMFVVTPVHGDAPIHILSSAIATIPMSEDQSRLVSFRRRSTWLLLVASSDSYLGKVYIN